MFYWMASFRPFSGLNAGTFAAAISIVSPVCGLRPVRAARSRTSKLPKPGIDLLGANVNLAGAELDLIGMSDREYRLKNVLDQVKDDYDYVFIDCPPSLGLLTLNCLCAADSFLVPLQCEYYALEGLSQLMTTVRMVKKALNRKLVMEGVLLTMFDGRTNLSIQVVEEVKKHFPGEVFSAVVPRNVRLSEAPSHGKPITAYDRMCRGAEAYLALADEILKKNDRKGRS